jgi:hypothetical protein
MIEQWLFLFTCIRRVHAVLVVDEVLSHLNRGDHWPVVGDSLLQAVLTVDVGETLPIGLDGRDGPVEVALLRGAHEGIVRGE